jgi:CRP-like cAMP-binding protein
MKTQNRLLAFLPSKDLALLEPHFKRERFTRGEVLVGTATQFRNVLFIESGAVSYVSIMEDGAAVESISIGREGALGLIAWAGPGFLPLRRGIVQISGEGLAVSLATLSAAARKSEAIRDMAARYATFLLSHCMQLVACNARHSVEARLARWLLTCAHRIDGQILEFQHDYLAETLGVVRTTVTLAARSLQSAGLILYSRGRIQILDIDGLNDLACDCYGVFRSELERILPLPPKRLTEKRARSRSQRRRETSDI